MKNQAKQIIVKNVFNREMQSEKNLKISKLMNDNIKNYRFKLQIKLLFV